MAPALRRALWALTMAAPALCLRLSWAPSMSADRRAVVAQSFAGLAGLGAMSPWARPGPAGAVVYLDPDRYGDKELKIGTVASIKQQLRNTILSNPKLTPCFLELAVKDALSYDAKSRKGGLDGSTALALSKDTSDANLAAAVKALLGVKATLQRTKEVTFADIIAFAGAEAIESTGGPTSQVQIGRYDRKAETAAPATIPDDPVAAFKRAGLGSREAALLIAAAGEIAMATRELEGDQRLEDEDEDDAPSMDDYVPSTFGAPREIYGKQVASGFGVQYLDAMKKGKKVGTINPVWESALLGDTELQGWVTKYAGNKGGFKKDVAEAYQKLTLLGTEYTTRNQK